MRHRHTTERNTLLAAFQAFGCQAIGPTDNQVDMCEFRHPALQLARPVGTGPGFAFIIERNIETSRSQLRANRLRFARAPLLGRLPGCRRRKWYGNQVQSQFPWHSLEIIRTAGIDPGWHLLRHVNDLDLHPYSPASSSPQSFSSS